MINSKGPGFNGKGRLRFSPFPSKMMVLVGVPGLFLGIALGQGELLTTLRVHSDLVLIDVIPEDSNGSFVEDLGIDEIEVKEDGKKQKIKFFQPIFSASERDSGSLSNPVPMVFVVDLNNLSASRLPFIKDSVIEWVREASAQNRYMLVTIDGDLKLRSEFTADREAFIESVESIGTGNEPLLYRDLIERMLIGFRSPMRDQAMEQAIGEGKMYILRMKERALSTAEGLGNLADYLSLIPGRKNAVLFSGGYPLNTGVTVYDIVRQFTSGMAGHIVSAKLGYSTYTVVPEKITEAIRRLNTARTSVYAVDARGSISEGMTVIRDRDLLSPSMLATLNSEDITAPRGSLELIGNESSGRFFGHTNDLGIGIQAAQQESNRYYLVGYVPPKGSKSEKYRRVAIESLRKGVDLRYRKGYVSQGQDESTDQTLLAALQFPVLFQDFQVEISPTVKDGQITVSVQVPTEALQFEEEGGQFNCTLSLFGVLINDEGKWETGGKKYSMAKEFRLRMNGEQLDALRNRRTVTAVAQGSIGPGDYQLVVVLRQLPSQVMSAGTIEVHAE